MTGLDLLLIGPGQNGAGLDLDLDPTTTTSETGMGRTRHIVIKSRPYSSSITPKKKSCRLSRLITALQVMWTRYT